MNSASPDSLQLRQADAAWLAPPASAELQLGLHAVQIGDWVAALSCFRSALAADPQLPEAWLGLGYACAMASRPHEALLAFESALRLAPLHTWPRQSRQTLGFLYVNASRFDEAVALLEPIYDADQTANATDPLLMNAMAQAYCGARLFSAGLQVYNALEARHGLSPEQRMNFAMLLFKRFRHSGEVQNLPDHWARAWFNYEHRHPLHGADGNTYYPHPQPWWQGEPLAGKTVLVHREQGYGDMIMFASTLHELLPQAQHVVLAAPPGLQRLFAHNFPQAHIFSSRVVQGNAALVTQDEWLPAALAKVGRIDYQLPFCSLGSRLRPDVASFKARFDSHGKPSAYLTAPPQLAHKHGQYLDAVCRPNRPRVGLVWTASAHHHTGPGAQNGGQKSMHWRFLEPLAAAPVHWVSLMTTECAAEHAQTRQLKALDMSWAIADFADTAAIIANLDLVIAVDTAVAHLAGAMGKPVWMLGWWNLDWRWDHEDANLWYPNVTVIKQPQAGDWAAVVSEVVAKLTVFTDAFSKAAVPLSKEPHGPQGAQNTASEHKTAGGAT